MAARRRRPGPGPSRRPGDRARGARPSAEAAPAGAGASGAPRGPGRRGAHPDDRDPQLLDTTLGRLVADHGWELDLRVHGVFARWAELVGARGGRSTAPRSRSPTGRLVVRTDSTAWATQLRAARARPSYAGSTRSSGHGTVTVIDVLGPHRPDLEEGPPARCATAGVRATPTAEPSPAGSARERAAGRSDVWGPRPTPRAGPPSARRGPLRPTFRPQIPPIHRVATWLDGALSGYHGRWVVELP